MVRHALLNPTISPAISSVPYHSNLAAGLSQTSLLFFPALIGQFRGYAPDGRASDRQAPEVDDDLSDGDMGFEDFEIGGEGFSEDDDEGIIVQKFVEALVSLILPISQSADHSDRVDRWSPQEQKLVQLHSPEAYEMIKNHLALILGQRLEDSNTVVPISKLRIGQVYAASVMYGYFLKRVDQHFQLEKSMKTLPWGSSEEENAIKRAIPDESRPSAQDANLISKLPTWYFA